MAGRYDIFVSYSWEQKPLARNLKRALTKMAKKWYQVRARRVFLDSSSLTAGKDLDDSVRDALQRSENFLLIASPSAKASLWVTLELDEWLSLHGPENILIILAEGEIKWSHGSFDNEGSTALPESALMCFNREPIWVDLRDLDLSGERDRIPSTAASIVAGITGKDKDEIYDEDLKQQKKVKQISLAIAAVMTLLVAGLYLVSREALHQRDAARANAAIANAHALASSSSTLLKTRFNTALGLAAAGNATVDDVYTRSALLQALTYNPHIVRYFRASDFIRDVLWMGNTPDLLIWGVHIAQIANPATGQTVSLPVTSPLSAAAPSVDGKLVALGSKDGSVRLWATTSREIVWSMNAFDKPVVYIEIDPAGGRLAAVSGSGSISVISLQTGRVLTSASADTSGLTGTAWRVTFVGRSLVAVVSDRGEFLTVPLGGSRGPSQWSEPVVPAARAQQLSLWNIGGGLGLSYPKGGTVHTVEVAGQPKVWTFKHDIASKPGAFAVSDDGRLAATESNGILAVEPAVASPAQSFPTAHLPGAATAGSNLAISPDQTMIASGYGRTIGVWDLAGVAGIARSLPTDVRTPAQGMTPQSIVDDANASTVIAIRQPASAHGDQMPAAALTCWDTSKGELRGTQSIPGYGAVNALAWNRDRTGLVAAMSEPTGLRAIPIIDGCPAGAGVDLAQFPGESGALIASVSPMPGSSLILLLRSGRLIKIETNGHITRSWGTLDKPGQRVSTYAVSPGSDELVIGMRNGGVSSYSLREGDLSARWTHPRAGGEVVSITFVSDQTIAVSRNAGNVFLFDRSTGAQQYILPSAQGYLLSTAASGTVLLGTEPGYRLAVWDTKTWRLMARFRFAYPAPAEVVSGEGGAKSQWRTTMVATPAGEVWLAAPGVSITSWDFRASDWLKVACKIVGGEQSGASATGSEYDPTAGPRWCTHS